MRAPGARQAMLSRLQQTVLVDPPMEEHPQQALPTVLQFLTKKTDA
jgi:hypothetical protein